MYKDIDLDGDGMLTLKEFTKAAKQALVQAREMERAVEELARIEREEQRVVSEEERERALDEAMTSRFMDKVVPGS